MAKYIKLDSGSLAEEQPITTSAGAGDASKVAQTDGTGRFAESLMPLGFGADVVELEASENLSAGDLINIFDDTGTAKARKADASAIGTKAVGFLLATVTSGQTATVYFSRLNDQLTGLSIGATYWLSETAGAITTTPPTGAGVISQKVGTAVNATTLAFEPAQPVIQLA